MLRKPPVNSIDGVRLDLFQPGGQYDLGTSIAGLLLAEGWAEPVDSTDPAVVIPMSEFAPDATALADPHNLIREFYPPSYDGPVALAADRRARRRNLKLV